MRSSFAARQSGRANGARPLALFLSLLLFTAALPTGSSSQTAQPASRSATDFSTTSGEEAAGVVGSSQASTPDEATQARIAEAYGKLSLRFEANRGQTDPQVKFIARGSGYGLFLTSTEAVLVLNKPAAKEEKGGRAKAPTELQAKIRGAEHRNREGVERGKDSKASEPESVVLRMKLEGASPAPQAEGIDELPGKSNYFIGNDPQKWRTDVPSYARVMFRGVYPGVDLIYYGKGQQLEYDFVVAPGVDPASIRLAFEGAQSIETDAQGDLVLHTEGGDVRQHKPVVYQEVDGARREIPSRYVLKDQQRVGFHVDAYDTNKPLIIDPVLIYSTLLGGSGSEEGFGIAVDAAGSAYVVGRTSSINFPVADPTQVYAGLSDAFISKLNPAGSALIYSTYLGGSQTERAHSVAVGPGGGAYVTGYTLSSDFPLMNPAQDALGGKNDAFIAKLSPQGSALAYSTYLGGSGYETGRGIDVDDAGRAYVTGFTHSQNFTTVNPLQAAKRGDQAFKSVDGGGNWSVSDTGLNVAYVDDLVIDPAQPSTLYAATELGVFKSTDSGSSWKAINNGLINIESVNGDAHRLVINPANPSTIYVMTFNGIYKSTNGGNSWSLSYDGGFTQGFFFADALAIDPSNPSNLYASVNTFSLRSTNAGGSWQQFSIFNEFGFPERVTAFAVDPANSSIVYAGTDGSGIYKSTDGGASWHLSSAGLIVNDIVNDLVFNPADPSTLYAITLLHNIYKSTDGGLNWSAANTGLPDTSEVLALAVDPAQPDTLYAGTDGSGLFKSTDAGGTWSPSETGLTNKVVTNIVVDPTSTFKVYASTSSGPDAFITKLNRTGSTLHYSTYLGGNERDGGQDIVAGVDESPYLTGLTASTNFPTANPFEGSFASPDSSTTDAFVTKLDASGSNLSYSTYLGGNGNEQGNGIAVDHQGQVFVAGFAQQFDSTLPMSFPTTPGAFQTAFDSGSFSDAFVTKINAAGSNLVYSTYLGGNSTDYGLAIAVNSEGQAFVTGSTLSEDFPLAGATQSNLNDFEAFVTRFNAAGSFLVFSTYLGGHDESSLFTDQGNGIAVDSASNAYVIGNTTALDFPTTPNALKKFKSGVSDAFITKIGAPPESVRISGKIKHEGYGLGGVTLTLRNKSGVVIQTTTTRSDGSYFFDVPGGRDYTITPAKFGYNFGPDKLVFTKVGSDLPRQNFTAASPSFTIFNYAEGHGGVPIAFVRFTLTGSRTGSCITDQSGSCAIPNLPIGGDYTVTPWKRGADFTPQSRTFQNLSFDQSVFFKTAFSISGRVTGINNTGVSGVKVELSGNRTATTTTNSNGHYTFGNLPAGASYQVTPRKAGVHFHHEHREIHNLTTPQTFNFEALVSLTGKVKRADTNTRLSGVTVRLTGSHSATRTTNDDGIFTFATLPYGGDYTVTPLKWDYNFSPPSRTYNDLSSSRGPSVVVFYATPK